MPANTQTEVQPAPAPDDLAEMAEAFESREFSEDELEAIRKTRRGTPR